jgi:hypothetical protein
MAKMTKLRFARLSGLLAVATSLAALVVLLVNALRGDHIQWGLVVVLFIMLGGSGAGLYRSRLTKT